MAETPTLYVCHGDEGGPRIHPCRRVQEALQEAGIPYEKKKQETSTDKLPACIEDQGWAASRLVTRR